MRYGFLSDAHGNVEAFAQALGVLRDEGAEQIWFLGDAVGYLAGDAVVRALKESALPSILGNQEAFLLAGNLDPERDAVYRIGQTAKALSRDLRDFIATWPQQQCLESAAGRIVLVHGSPSDPTFGYVYPDTDLASFQVPAGTAVFMANTHRPFVRECGGALFVNIGSCGLPRDSGSMGAACIYDSATNVAHIVRFDIGAATAAALARSGPVHPSVEAVYRRPTPLDLVGVRHGR